MAVPEPSSTPEPKVDNELGGFLTLLLMLAALAALGWSGLKFIDIVKLSPEPPASPPAFIN